MKVENISAAVLAQIESKKKNLSEEYQKKLDEYIQRVTNPSHLTKLLQEEDIEKGLDEREQKKLANDKYTQNKAKEADTFEALFKSNIDTDLSAADFDDLTKIKAILSEKLEMVNNLLDSKKADKIKQLEEQLKALKSSNF